MKVEREDFERSFERFEMPEPALERLVERRERRRRRERIEAGIAALVVVAATAAVLARAFVATPVPAGPTLSVAGPCAAPQLRPSPTMERAGGAREGEIVFTNVSDTSCTLQGTPAWLLDTNGGRINGIDFVSSPARWQVEGDPNRKVGPSSRSSLGIARDPPAVVELVRHRRDFLVRAAGGRWRGRADRPN